MPAALPPPEPPRGRRPVVTVSEPEYWTADHTRVFDHLAPHVTYHHCVGAGADYVDLCRGRLDAAVFTWDTVWDHAAGVVLVEELGGTVRAVDGGPFDVTGATALPFVVSPHHDLAEDLLRRIADVRAPT